MSAIEVLVILALVAGAFVFGVVLGWRASDRSRYRRLQRAIEEMWRTPL